jgi:hypothetical protein
LHTEQKKKRAAIEAIQNLVRKKSKSQAVPQVDGGLGRSDEADISSQISKLPSPDIKSDDHGRVKDLPSIPDAPMTCPSVEHVPPVSPHQTADTIFENIRTQYFEALYKSMVGILLY